MSDNEPEAPQPERIDAALLDYHREVLAELREKQAIARAWSAHLARRYGLALGDRVAEDGTIVRAAKANEG